MERTDPFYVVQDEVVQSLSQAKSQYETWKSEKANKSTIAKISEEALKKIVQNIWWDLEDLQDTVLIVEKDPAKFNISLEELRTRQNFLQEVKNILWAVSDHLADARDSVHRKAINFDVSSSISMHSERANGLTFLPTSDNSLKISSSNRLCQPVSANSHPLEKRLLSDQEVLVKEQDSHLDQLGSSISRLKEMSHRIGGELEDHVALLEDFGEEMTHTESKLDSTTKRAARLLHLDSDRRQWCAIGSLIISIIIILILFFIL